MFFSKRFFPLFWVQFLGAFNDNVFKNALVMLVTFKLAKDPAEIGLLITLAAGVFILPFFLFSALAGQIADNYDKTWLTQKIKLAEVLIMLTGAVAFITGDIVFLYIVLFLMGVQSAFFGPIKYAILPEHLSKNELLTGNGWFSASTFVAILLGTIVGGFVSLIEGGLVWLSILIIFFAITGYVFSLFMPASVTPQHKIKLSVNFIKTTWLEIKYSRQYPQAFFAVLAISWFWFLGATYLSQIPVMVKDLIFADDKVVLLFLATFSIGIAKGALIVNYLNLKIRTIHDVRWLGLLLLGISVAIWLSNLAMGLIEQTEKALLLQDFFFELMPMTVLLLLGCIAILGGMYIVPLYTLLQTQTPQGSRSRMVAVNNIMNAIFMVVSAILIMLLYAIDWSLVNIFTVILGLNLLVFISFYKRVDDEIFI